MQLDEAIKAIVNQFGKEIIAERRFIYMIADYYSFRDNPAEKRVLSTLVNDGYSAKLISLNDVNTQKSILIEKLIIDDVYRNYGYSKDLVDNILNAIVKGIGFSSNELEIKLDNEGEDFDQTINDDCKTNDTQIEENVDVEIAFYRGGELLRCLIEFFITPSKQSGHQQFYLVQKKYGNKKGHELIDYFQRMKLIKYDYVNEYFICKLDDALRITRLHDEAYHKKDPSAIANHILIYKQIPTNKITISFIKLYYKCSDRVANEVFKYLLVPNPEIPLRFPNEMIKQVIIKLLHNRPIGDCMTSVPIKDVGEVMHLFEKSGILDNNGKLRKEGFYINPSVQSILNRIQKTETILYNN